MLQECCPKIKSKFVDYLSYATVRGHCRTINLFIHKRLNPEIQNMDKQSLHQFN
jgi:hypothetical protein